MVHNHPLLNCFLQRRVPKSVNDTAVHWPTADSDVLWDWLRFICQIVIEFDDLIHGCDHVHLGSIIVDKVLTDH